MKILIVSKIPTHPISEGNRKFILSQVEFYKQKGHDVYFLFIQEPSIQKKHRVDLSEIKELHDFWREKLFIFKISLYDKIKSILLKNFRKYFNNGYFKCDDWYPRNLDRFVKKINNQYNFDCCIINYYYLSKLFTKIDIPLKGIITHDYFAYKNILVQKRFVDYCIDANQEAKALQRCPNIFALNEEEGIYFTKLAPNNNVYCIYNTFEYHSSKIVGNRNILFLSGSNQYNINGLNWFVNSIFPSILKLFPETKLIIGGAICKHLNHLESPNIELQGYINSAIDFYSQADVVINPTYQGTGLKIKTFESISYDKITITHPHSLIGIYQKESAPIFASTKAEEWCNFLSEIWRDPSQCENIKEQNRQYIDNMNRYIEREYNSFFSKVLIK